MRKLLMALGAAAAVWFLPVHVALLAVLLYIWASAMTSTTNTAKARATEARVNSLVTTVGTTNTNVANLTTALSGQATGTGLPAGTPTGGPNQIQSGLATTDSASYPTGTTSGASAGTAHTHDYGGHWHVLNFELPIATHTHDFDGHTHDLPSV